jgi:hypothetical protein
VPDVEPPPPPPPLSPPPPHATKNRVNAVLIKARANDCVFTFSPCTHSGAKSCSIKQMCSISAYKPCWTEPRGRRSLRELSRLREWKSTGCHEAKALGEEEGRGKLAQGRNNRSALCRMKMWIGSMRLPPYCTLVQLCQPTTPGGGVLIVCSGSNAAAERKPWHNARSHPIFETEHFDRIKSHRGARQR